MTRPGGLPGSVETMVRTLRRRGLPLGVDDCVALRSALAAGFGLSSTRALQDLCVALWAKTPQEVAVVRAVFASSDVADWDVAGPPAAPIPALPDPDHPAMPGAVPVSGAAPAAAPAAEQAPLPRTRATTLTLSPPSAGPDDPALLLVPQYPVSERQVAQAWRRLRKPMRHGPPVEVDVEETIIRRSRSAVATPPVLVPARRNTARLLLLIDRTGSMTPYHGYIDHIRHAIESAGRLDAITVVYFYNLPGRSPDQSALESLDNPFSPTLDAILPMISPLRGGCVYTDPELIQPRELADVLDRLTPGTAVAVVSDAGAARSSQNTVRLLDSIALLKAIRARTGAVAWFNPAPIRQWATSTAAQIARHVPMFPVTVEGMHAAVEVLRGRPFTVEKPL